MVNEFVSAKLALDTIRAMEDRERREYVKKCDWYDPLDVAEYRRTTAMEERERVVLHLCPDYACPICKVVLPNIRSWVISKHNDSAVCRGCYVRSKQTVSSEDKQLYFSIFEEIKRYKLEWRNLISSREASGVSQREFARLAGWTSVYQNKLESGSIVSVTSETHDVILGVLKRLRVFTDDVIQSDDIN